MTYVIAEPCIGEKNAACVEVCPVACIHTTPDSPQYYIDPDVCIECEQCKIVCPVEAIYVDFDLPAEWHGYLEINARFFRQNKAVMEPVPVEKAWEMIGAAHAYAAQAGIAITAAVVDEAGGPIAVGRMDDAAWSSAELALHKAYTAVAFQVPTQQLGREARQPWFRSLSVASRGLIMGGGGGIPIVEDTVMIGAIGVAGGSKDEQDVLCSRAGLATLQSTGH